MQSSTAIPMVIEAMVMVMMSSGIFIQPMKPRIVTAPSRLGRMPITATLSERNIKMSGTMMHASAEPKVRICDLYRLCSTLL